MVNPFEHSNSNLTLDGNTVELQTVEPSENYHELVCTARSPRNEEVEVRYKLKSDTPQDTLDDLFETDFTIATAGTNHKLLVENDDVSVVYSDPYYPNGI